MDVFTPEERHEVMAKIHGKDTSVEVYLRKLLWRMGLRYRKNAKGLPGHPDIYLPKYHVAIFVHGCFWHQHQGCKTARMPKSNEEFWAGKFRRNKERDERVASQLLGLGIRTLVVWECTVRHMMKDEVFRDDTLAAILLFFMDGGPYQEL